MSEGWCPHSTESHTLRSVCSKVGVYDRVLIKGMANKPQIHPRLVFELGAGWGVFLKGKNKEAGIRHPLMTFLDQSFRGSGCPRFIFSDHVVHGLGAC